LGVLVVAGRVGVAAAAVQGDGGLEVVFAVEVDPAEAGGAGGVFEGVHEAGGEVVAAEFGEDEEALALGGVRDFEGAVEDAAGDLVLGENARRGRSRRGVGGGWLEGVFVVEWCTSPSL
jgi:hypothetical protein